MSLPLRRTKKAARDVTSRSSQELHPSDRVNYRESKSLGQNPQQLPMELVYPSTAADGSAAVDNGRQMAPAASPLTSHRSAMRRTGTWIIRVPQIGRTTLLGTCHLGSRVLARPYRAARRQAYRLCTARARLVHKRAMMGAVRGVMQRSKAISTRSQQDRLWQTFSDSCEARFVRALPAAPDDVACFLVAIAMEHDYSMGYIRAHATAISVRHKDADLENPCDHRSVKDTLKGLQYDRLDEGHRQTRALTREVFSSIRATACLPRRRGRGREHVTTAGIRGDLDIAIIGLTRSGSLRACETARARWERLSSNADGTGYLEIPYSKANRGGKSEIVHINRQAMADLERIRPPGVTMGSIFGLSTASISRRIGAAAEAAGWGAGFSGHSCRVGKTIDLARAGATERQLIKDGRWKSAVMVRYYLRYFDADCGASACYFANPANEA